MCVVHKPAANAGPTTGERLVHETDIGAIRWLQQCSPHSAVRPKGWGKQRATGYGLNVLQTEKKIRSETMSKSGSYIGGHTVITVPRGPKDMARRQAHWKRDRERSGTAVQRRVGER